MFIENQTRFCTRSGLLHVEVLEGLLALAPSTGRTLSGGQPGFRSMP